MTYQKSSIITTYSYHTKMCCKNLPLKKNPKKSDIFYAIYVKKIYILEIDKRYHNSRLENDDF